jgi:hypothetical protein
MNRVSRFGIVLAGVVLAFTVALAGEVRADSQCPAGTQPATAADVPIMQAAGITGAVVGMCWNQNDFSDGETSGKAKQYLTTLLQTSNQCMAPQLQIAGLNSSFAICASRFLQAFQQTYGGTVTITRAYFTTQCEAQLCVNNAECGALNNVANPVSNHTRGFAMDVTASVGQTQIAQFAQQNPQYGVCFPFSSAYGSSFKDNVHMILAGIPGSEPSGPGCSNVKQACSAGNYNPNALVAGAQPATPAPPAQPIPSAPPASGLPASYYGNPSQPLSSTPTAQPLQIAPTTAASPFIAQSSTLTPSTALLSSLPQTQPLSLSAFTTATSAASILQQFTDLTGTASPTVPNGLLGPVGSFASSTSSPDRIITIIASGSAPSAPVEQSTFSSTNYTMPAAQGSSQLSQIFSSLARILVGLIGYLRSLVATK